MFETLTLVLKIYGLGLLGGVGAGLIYFYWMRSSIRLAVRSEHPYRWLMFFTIFRLICMATILLDIIQQGVGMLVCFMIGFAAARFIMLSVAIDETGEKHAV